MRTATTGAALGQTLSSGLAGLLGGAAYGTFRGTEVGTEVGDGGAAAGRRRLSVNPVLKALIPALAVGWVVFCLVNLVRAKEVRYLPKWGWAILCVGIGLTIPFGGILYLTVGRVRRPKPSGCPGSA